MGKVSYYTPTMGLCFYSHSARPLNPQPLSGTQWLSAPLRAPEFQPEFLTMLSALPCSYQCGLSLMFYLAFGTWWDAWSEQPGHHHCKSMYTDWREPVLPNGTARCEHHALPGPQNRLFWEAPSLGPAASPGPCQPRGAALILLFSHHCFSSVPGHSFILLSPCEQR